MDNEISQSSLPNHEVDYHEKISGVKDHTEKVTFNYWLRFLKSAMRGVYKNSLTYMLVRHKVADFTKWKLVFDSHTAAQRESGLKIEHILRNIDDPAAAELNYFLMN